MEAMINKEDLKKRVLEEEDFIKCPRFFNSLQKYLAKASEEVDNRTIAKLLLIKEEEVKQLYDEAVKLIKEDIGED
jgi:predicted RNase H-like nuclease